MAESAIPLLKHRLDKEKGLVFHFDTIEFLFIQPSGCYISSSHDRHRS